MKVLALTLVLVVSFLQFLQVSSTEEDVCSLPSVTGPCRALFPRWFYDVKKGKCSQFIYGGCDGNKNNFRTEEECEKRCDSEKTAEYPCFRALQKALGPAILVHGEPVPIHKSSHLPSCDQEGYFSPKQCDKTTGECWCVSRLGKEILNTRKQGKDVSCDVCTLPKVVGPCLAAFPRWFFNKASGKCEQFIYGGCQGNGNNFEGEKECQAMCLPHKLRVKKAPTKCQKEALEATQSKLVGRFIPRCNPDGSYNLIQCHASTGYCWCSNLDGTKYPGTDVRGKPNCEKYKALPEVATLFAALPVKGKCLQEQLEATQSHLLGRFVPRCNEDGTYQLIQCHASTAYCWCAAPDGTKYPGTDVRFKQPNCDKYRSKTALSKCQREALGSKRSKRALVGRFIPKCNEDGSYQLVQCHGSTGYCWCSDSDGTKFPGTDVPPGKQINCDKYKGKPALSKCQQEVLEATRSHLMGRYVPQCNEDGSYELVQCHGSTGYCWCSAPDGTKFPGTDVPPGKQINCDKYKGKPALSKCQQEVLEATRSHLMGKYVPQCNEDGSYQLIQCHGSTGYCWCSAPDGTKFPGTNVPPGKQINCEKYKGKTVDKCLNVKCPSPYAQCRVVSGKAECRCPIACALVYFPVCGTDGKTYANDCVMKAKACKLNKTITVEKKGKCDNVKEERSVVKASYQEKQTQNSQSSSPASSGSSTALIVLSVCAALCVMAVVGVVLVRRRRGSDRYGRLPETTFQPITGEKQPLVHA